MSRRSRNSRAWRYVWGGIRRDADARALVLASENEEWGYDRLEVSIQVLLFSPEGTALNRMSHQHLPQGAVPNLKASILAVVVTVCVCLFVDAHI